MKTAKATPGNDILLGKGVFYIGEFPIGLTKGGGQFVVERETRQIKADGDRGYVKGRIVQDEATPKLTVNSLQVINKNIDKMYSGLKKTVSEGKTKITGTGGISTDDYSPLVKWVGTTKGGREVVITVHNAINLDNIDWALVDKDEVVGSLTYVGCYEEDSPSDYEPWDVEYAD